MSRVTMVLLGSAIAAAGVAGQTSSDAARQLTALLDSRSLTAVAVADPEQPGTFVAALYIPRSQLLVVQARHPSVAGLAHRLGNAQYRDVYLDLQATPTPEGKFFVHDSGADGIVGAPSGGSIDVLYEDGVRQTLFNGKAAEQNLTRAKYDAKVIAADERYSRLLTLLVSALRPADGAGAH
jgi:hypothetical protein